MTMTKIAAGPVGPQRSRVGDQRRNAAEMGANADHYKVFGPNGAGPILRVSRLLWFVGIGVAQPREQRSCLEFAQDRRRSVYDKNGVRAPRDDNLLTRKELRNIDRDRPSGGQHVRGRLHLVNERPRGKKCASSARGCRGKQKEIATLDGWVTLGHGSRNLARLCGSNLTFR